MFSGVSGLYGTRVRPVPPFGSLSSNPPVDPALIHQVLPDELLSEVKIDFLSVFNIQGAYVWSFHFDNRN